jgi:hypothetical protein
MGVKSGDVDRHRLDADPDPDLTFNFDADPDPDPTSSFTHVGKIVFPQRHKCQNFHHFGQYLQYIRIFWEKYI